MEEIKNISSEFCKKLTYWFTDIDDTITSEGVLPAESYKCLWDLYNQGINVVPITGRPAGWCDMIARMWPVKAVIGENGAFYFSYEREAKNFKRVFTQSHTNMEENSNKLEKVKREILEKVPGAAIASDQKYRMFDLAIDFCEDVEPLSDEEIGTICAILDREKITYKLSSIHINCWIGNYDKLTCMELFLQNEVKKSLDEMQGSIIFSGDSPNDEPMFKALDSSFAVANIQNYINMIQHKPTYVSTKLSGDGFVEAVETVLAKRNQS